MKKIAIFSTCLGLASALFGAEAQTVSTAIAPEAVKSEALQFRSFSILDENDLGFSDRYYTNGLKFQYTELGDDWWASWAQFEFLKLFVPDGRQAFQSAALGQNMYVSSNINIVNPAPTDHPYSGYLYLACGAHLASETRMDSFAINLGIVGPQSFAEQTQTTYHDIIGADKPEGWHTQLQDEPGVVVAYNHAERLFKYKFSQGLGTDVIASAGVNLGNVMTDARVKGLWRIGYNMPNSFDISRIDYSMAGDPQWLDGAAPASWHLYFYGGALARFVAYDIALNGNTWRQNPSVTPEPIVGEFSAGMSARYERVQFDLTWNVQTKSFDTQEFTPFIFWSAAVRIFF